MKQWMMIIVLVCLAGCSSTPDQPLPTLAQLPTHADATPTTENESGGPTGITPENPLEDGIQIQFSGALTGTFTDALLSFETGSDYILLLEQPDDVNPVQLRLILAGNIEPGTYPIVPAADFQRPPGATVAARFDLGFVAESINGTFVLESIGENLFTGALDLTAQAEEGTVVVTGRFQNLNVAVIG